MNGSGCSCDGASCFPGRYTFGLTGRGPTGNRLGRGTYTIRVLAFPGDGTRRQADTIEYRVR